MRGDAEDVYRPGDILDLPLAHVLEGQLELVADLIVYSPAHTDSIGFGEAFESCSDVDAIAANIIAVDDNVADIDTHAELDAPISWKLGVPLDRATLHFNRAAHGIHYAWELDKNTVTRGLDHAASVLSDLRVDLLSSVSLEARESAFLVDAHEPAVAGHVSG
jgi:hypothetical protein